LKNKQKIQTRPELSERWSICNSEGDKLTGEMNKQVMSLLERKNKNKKTKEIKGN